MSRKVEWIFWFLEELNLFFDGCGNVEWEDYSESLIYLLGRMGVIRGDVGGSIVLLD